MATSKNALAPQPSNSLAYGPRNLMGTQMLRGPNEAYLRQQFPGLYGFLGGVVGTAPDQMAGSVLDPNTAAVRQGAEYGFPVGTALGMLPGVGPLLRATKGLPVGMGIKDVSKSAITREGNPIQGAVVLVGDKIFMGRTHGDALNRAVYDGVVRKEGGKYIFPKGAEVNSDLFMTKDGQIIDRFQASKMFDIGASETAIKEGLMQNNPPRSMTVDSYIEQAKALKKQREQLPYPQQAALDLAQQRAALPVEQGGLGLLSSNTAEQRASAMLAEDVYHGTNAEKQILNDLNFNLDADQRSVGGIWTTKDKNYASWLADKKDKDSASVMSLKLLNAKNSNEYDILQEGIKLADEIGVPIPKNALEAQELLAGGYGWDRVIGDLLHQNKTPNLKITNFNDAYHSNPNEVTTAFITKDPSLLRLPNAAFDPFRRSAAIAATMGVAAPDLLAAEDDKVGVNKMRKLKANK